MRNPKQENLLYNAPRAWLLETLESARDKAKSTADEFFRRVRSAPSPIDHLQVSIARCKAGLYCEYGFEYRAEGINPFDIPARRDDIPLEYELPTGLTPRQSLSRFCGLVFNIRIREILLDCLRNKVNPVITSEDERKVTNEFILAYPPFLAVALCQAEEGPDNARRVLAGYIDARIEKIEERLEKRLGKLRSEQIAANPTRPTIGSMKDTDFLPMKDDPRSHLLREIYFSLNELLEQNQPTPFDPPKLATMHGKAEYRLAPGGGKPGGGSGPLKQEKFESNLVSLDKLQEGGAEPSDETSLHDEMDYSLIQREDMAELKEGFAALCANTPPGERRVIDAKKQLLSQHEDATDEEVAAVLQVSPGTVKTSYSRIRKRARKYLKKSL